MLRTTKYCVIKAKHGQALMPGTKWNGDHNFEFFIGRKSDSDYDKCPGTEKGVSRYIIYLCGAVVTVKSLMQRTVALSVIEAGILSGTQCTQDMLYVYIILNIILFK